MNELPSGNSRLAKSHKESIWYRLLTIILVLLLVGATVALFYVIINPGEDKPFTDFYLLGLDGESANYPRELEVGEEGKVIVGIINHEGEEITYRVEVILDGQKSGEMGWVTLIDKHKWETEMSFVFKEMGENQRVEFMLYKDNEVDPYLNLYLLVNVIE